MITLPRCRGLILPPSLRRQRGFLINPYSHGSAGTPTDPFFANVAALLHFDDVDGSSSFVDEIGHAFIRNNANPEIDTAQFVFGGSSLLLGGGSGNVVRSNASEADFGLGAADFTIEMWTRFSNVGGTQFIYDMRPLSAGLGPIILFDGGEWKAYLNGDFRISGGAAVINTWYHVALTRESGVARLFVNGLQVGANATDAANYGSSQYIILGGPADAFAILNFIGWIDDLRVTVGVCRYAANFSPPSAPFPNSGP